MKADMPAEGPNYFQRGVPKTMESISERNDNNNDKNNNDNYNDNNNNNSSSSCYH